MFLAVFDCTVKSLCVTGRVDILPKYGCFKMPPVRLFTYTISASFVPILAPFTITGMIVPKIAHIRWPKVLIYKYTVQKYCKLFHIPMQEYSAIDSS